VQRLSRRGLDPGCSCAAEREVEKCRNRPAATPPQAASDTKRLLALREDAAEYSTATSPVRIGTGRAELRVGDAPKAPVLPEDAFSG